MESGEDIPPFFSNTLQENVPNHCGNGNVRERNKLHLSTYGFSLINEERDLRYIYIVLI